MFGQKIAPAGINVWNPAFDVTPCSLIKGIITELGVVEATFSDKTDENATIIPLSAYLQAKQAEITNQDLIARIQQAIAPVESPSKYYIMNESKIIDYIFNSPKLMKLLALDVNTADRATALTIDEVGDGNLNLVFIIKSTTTDRAIVAKQALPYVRCVGESWPLTLERATFEADALMAEIALTGGRFVPEVYLFDEALALIGECC